MKRAKLFFALHALLMLLSLAPICSKMAGRYPFLSWPFLLYYGGTILILGIYALAWQQIIKRMPLSSAYANKAVTVVWGMLWGVLIFSETISIQKVLGAIVIIAGVALYAFSDKNGEGETNAR